MASKRKPKASKGEAKERSDPNRDLLQRIRDRYKVMVDADQENRRLAMEDLKFVNEPGAQWDQNMKTERGTRPCYEFNKLRINGKRVINEIRANRPQGKVRAVEGGDKKTAEIYEGLCRNIANMSDLDTITDTAAEYQVDAGMACWRVVRKYASDDVFDQDLLIEGIKNPFCLWVDPAAKDPLKRDAEDWILEDRISKEAYEAKYKGKEVASFDGGEFDDQDNWEETETVRIVEYWYKEPYDKEIWLVAFPQEDGTVRRITVDSTTDEADALKQQPGFEQLIERKRTARCQRIMMCVASGSALLEKPAAQVGTQHPFIMVFGETKVIEGKFRWWGLHRFAKDAQRSYNISRTAMDETVALAPQSKWWATPKQAEGVTEKWAQAHKENLPWLPYTPDPAAMNGAPPQRMMGADVPVALIQQASIATQDVRDVTGLHEASFGEESDEKSGVALARKQSQAQIVTYNFGDNMAKGVKRTWEIIIDQIPHVYDAERELRVLGSDGAEDYTKVNEVVFDPRTGKTVRVNDVTHGKYDVTITTGPSFATLRQEAAEIYPQIFPPDSPLYPFVADLVAQSMDYPYADKMAKRLRLAAPPAVQQMEAEGKEIPPEAQAALAQAEQAKAMVAQQAQLLQQAAQEVQKDKQASEKAKADAQIAIANLAKAKAEFDAHIAKVEAQLAQQGAQLDKRSGELDGRNLQLDVRQSQIESQQQQSGDVSSEVQKAQQAVAQIDEMTAQFMERFGALMRGVLEEAKQRPTPSRIRMKRDPATGEAYAEPEFDDPKPISS